MSINNISPKDELKVKINYFRKKSGLTQSEVAEKMGMTRSTYAYAETKASKLSHEFLMKLADVLGVPYKSLIDEGKFESAPVTLNNSVQSNEPFPISKKEQRIVKMLRMLSDESYAKVYKVLRDEYEENMDEE